MRNRKLLRSLLALSLIAAPGCSCFQPSTQALTVIPSDPRAEVLINGNPAGVGTVTRQVKRGDSYTIMVRVGDRAGTAQVSRKLSGTGVADIIGGIIFLVPFVGAFSPGFWDLDPNTVSVAVPADRYSSYSTPAPTNRPAR